MMFVALLRLRKFYWVLALVIYKLISEIIQNFINNIFDLSWKNRKGFKLCVLFFEKKKLLYIVFNKLIEDARFDW